MKTLPAALAFSGVFLIGPISADMAPQPQPVFSQGPQKNTYAMDWQGVAGRIYFMQRSVDLANWQYFPFIDFGDGMHSRGIVSLTDKGFFRLKCVDDPEITSLEQAQNADFDGDGLSNIFELAFGSNPFDADSTPGGPDNGPDPEEDGMTNATENAGGFNPMKKDNPKVMLQVVDF